MRNNCMILDVSYYRPEATLDNDYFISHFDAQGIDVRGLLKATGREIRHISTDENENILTMGCAAAKNVLEKAYIKPSQLNLIVFSSGTPEYLSPSNAIKLHADIGGGHKCAAYDLNANCAGMVFAVEQVSAIMRSDPNLKYALVVGSDQLYRYSRDTDPISYANFADASCAVLLENVFNTDRGFIDFDVYTNSVNHDKILIPPHGMSSIMRNGELDITDKAVQWTNFSFDGAFFSAKITIENLLFRNSLLKTDIKKYFVSQFSLANIKDICEHLEEDMSKFVYIGDDFGYTGTNSPFLAYARAVENNDINMGDYVVFWTVGAGTVCTGFLYRY